LYFFAREGVIAGVCSQHFLFDPTNMPALSGICMIYEAAKIQQE
jgi:hypothetical protein